MVRVSRCGRFIKNLLRSDQQIKMPTTNEWELVRGQGPIENPNQSGRKM